MTTRTSATRTAGPRGPVWLGLSAAVGGIGPTILYLVLGALRPGYDPVRQQISVLGTGSEGFWMNAGFVLAGLLVITGMIGFGLALAPRMQPRPRAAVITLLALPAFGLIICGFFPMDTDLLLHTIGAQIACGLPIFTFTIAACLLWRNSRPLAVWLIISAVFSLLALLGYLFLGPTTPHDFQTIHGGGIIGLWERILVTVIYVICYSTLGIIAVVLARRGHTTQLR